MKTQQRLSTHRPQRELREVVVAAKVERSIHQRLCLDAEEEGSSISMVIRRIIRNHYRQTAGA